MKASLHLSPFICARMARATSRFLLAGAMLTLAAGISSQASLIAYYNFDGNTLDSSGNGHNGTNFGATFISSSLSFNGAGNYVSLPSSMSSGLSAFSILLNVKTTQSVGVSPDWQNPTFFGMGTSGPGSRDLQIISKSGRAGFYSGLNTGGDYSYTAGPAINDGAWHSIGLTNDGTLLKFYVDGVLSNSTSVNQALASTPFYVGALDAPFNNPTASYFAAASIDEVRFYNNALTATEVQQLAVIAIPEPSRALLLCGGLMGVLLCRRRRSTVP
ncbi:MAG: PEP-CTERM sorting domain-containing protein [Verrucomicrobia bacterium]|nr:PEP-CTERM sorting domain-containing protein [Verrucomicrobiota bacterium]